MTEKWPKVAQVGTSSDPFYTEYWLVSRPWNDTYEAPDYSVRAYYKGESENISGGNYATPEAAVKNAIEYEHRAKWDEGSKFIRAARILLTREQSERDRERAQEESERTAAAELAARLDSEAKAVRFKRMTLEYPTKEGTKTATGYRVGDLFAFKEGKHWRGQEDMWSITHIASGKRIVAVTGGRDYAVRYAMAILLATDVDWSQDGKALERLAKVDDRLRTVVLRVKEGLWTEAYGTALEMSGG